jgi:predicted PurR-regulated permease PerM
MSPSDPRAAADRPAPTAHSLRPVAFAILTAILLVLCALLAWPFLPALAWGVALAVIAWPLQTWMSNRAASRSLTAALTTAVVVVVIVVPGLAVAYHLANEATSATEQMRGQAVQTTIRGKMAETPALSGVVGWMDRVGVDIDGEVRALVAGYTQNASALVRGSLMGIVQFAIAMFILYYMLRDREQLVRRVEGLLPMTRQEADRVLEGTAASVHANLRANLVTSLVASVGGGVMFWLLGLPSPVTWGAVMFFLSLLPMLGTWLVWIPAAVYLALVGQAVSAAILLAWGVAFSILVDNLLYIRIAGDRMRLHQVPALLSFLGGLAVFGVSGIILGPAILAATTAVLDVWHRRATGETAERAAEAQNEAEPNLVSPPVWPNGHPHLIGPGPA